MADDNKIQVEVSAQTENFGPGLEAAVNKLTAAVTQMTSLFSGLNSSVTSSMNQTAANTEKAASTMTDSITSSTGRMSSALTSLKNMIGAVGIGIVSAFGGAAKSALDYEKSLLALSRTSGLNIESASKLAYASSQYGMTTEDLGRNIGILSRNLSTLQKDSESTTNVFNRFHISVQDTNGKLLPADQILMNIADRFKSMPNGVEKTALSMEIFGRSGQQMIPMLNQGSEGLQKMGLTAEKLGLVLKDTSALSAYSAAQKQWTATLKGLEIQMGNATLPVLTAFSKSITALLQAFNSLDPGVRTTIITVTSVTGAVAALTLGWGAAAAAVTNFGGPFAKVGTMMAGMPNLLTGTVNGLQGMIARTADVTLAFTRYIVTGGLFTSAHTAMNAVMAATSSFMAGVRTATLATSLAYSTGGVSSIVKYCASLISMNSVMAVVRASLMLLYGTVAAGIAVVVALGLAWIGNFGNIQNATAGICDGISYGLNTFASGVKQWAGGIADSFANLAKAISRAFVGDFQGAWNAAKGIGDGITDMAKGFGTAFQGVGQAAYAAVTNPGAALNYVKASAGALWSGTKDMLGFGATTDTGNADAAAADMPSFSPDAVGGDSKKSGNNDTAYEKQKQLYENDVALNNYTQDEKLKKYKEYLATVYKLAKEEVDYNKGLKELETSQRKEQLEMERLDLETRVTEGKASEGELLKQKIAMAAEALSKEREGTLEYKKLLKEKMDAEKAYFDWQYQQLQQQLEREKQHNDSIISLEEEKIRHLKAMGLITEEEELKEKAALDEKSYSNQMANIDQLLQYEIDHNRTKTKEFKDLQDQKAAIEEKWNLKSIQNANAVKEAQLKNILEIKAVTTSSLSQAFQDIIKGTKGLVASIDSMLTTIGNTLLKQFTDKWASKISSKLFDGLLKKGDKGPDQTRVSQETATQSAITSVAAAGNAARLAALKASNLTAAASGSATATAIVTANVAAFTALLAMISAMAAAIAAIPPDGPAMAAAMAGGVSAATGILTGAASTAQAGITGSMSGLSSFDVGTWSVPQDMLAMVHKGEPIIPAPFADSARKVLSGEMIPAGALGGKTGGDVHMYYNPQVSLIDTRGAKKFFNDHARIMADSLGKVNRNFYKPNK